MVVIVVLFANAVFAAVFAVRTLEVGASSDLPDGDA
jgi:hypothetical protein